MDVQMPDLDGFEATKAIRERETNSGAHIPIIALTAHAMKGDRERCLTVGMDRYISKPVRAKELFESVEGLPRLSAQPAAAPVASYSNDGIFDEKVNAVRAVDPVPAVGDRQRNLTLER